MRMFSWSDGADADSGINGVGVRELLALSYLRRRGHRPAVPTSEVVRAFWGNTSRIPEVNDAVAWARRVVNLRPGSPKRGEFPLLRSAFSLLWSFFGTSLTAGVLAISVNVQPSLLPLVKTESMPPLVRGVEPAAFVLSDQLVREIVNRPSQTKVGSSPRNMAKGVLRNVTPGELAITKRTSGSLDQSRSSFPLSPSRVWDGLFKDTSPPVAGTTLKFSFGPIGRPPAAPRNLRLTQN
jgi:hypothetical protein